MNPSAPQTSPPTRSASEVRIATHNGSFHADDVFGVAVLMLLYPGAQLLRTRDAQAIRLADFAVDVGGQWDASRGRFDHHQRGFTGARDNGVVYASAGLVWQAYGPALVEHLFGLGDPALAQAVAADLDVDLVQHLDRADTGAAQGAPGLFGLSALLGQFNLTWDKVPSAGQDGPTGHGNFRRAVEVTTLFLEASLNHLRAKHQGAQLVRDSRRAHDGSVLVMSRAALPWTDVVCTEMPGVLFVVYPDSTDAQYQLHIVPVEPHSFVARKDLPRAWAGLRAAELAAMCGVSDAVFCHNACFIAGASSLNGALQMAQLALTEPA